MHIHASLLLGSHIYVFISSFIFFSHTPTVCLSAYFFVLPTPSLFTVLSFLYFRPPYQHIFYILLQYLFPPYHIYFPAPYHYGIFFFLPSHFPILFPAYFLLPFIISLPLIFNYSGFLVFLEATLHLCLIPPEFCLFSSLSFQFYSPLLPHSCLSPSLSVYPHYNHYHALGYQYYTTITTNIISLYINKHPPPPPPLLH